MRRIFSTREVVLGVTGSIAAYKACDIASRLAAFGARVTPVLTNMAQELVGAATFQALTGRRVVTGLFEPLANPDIEHIAVAARANLFLIAPATANCLAKAAAGIADDWLSTTLLATRAPVLFAPAMNANMYTHPATQANLKTLRERGCFTIGPAEGRLACGAEGIGRMADVDAIIEAAAPLVSNRKDLAGKRVLLTTGGTREPMDPVRFIGNRSSGKMGRALALEAIARGAHVVAVRGPSEVPLPYGVEVVAVETAAEMADAAMSRADQADIIVAAAAVADYRPSAQTTHKKKRDGKPTTLMLVENPDILSTICANRRPGQIIVAFAAETENLIGNATDKLERKGADAIVANIVGRADQGFGSDAVTVCIIERGVTPKDPRTISKDELAEAVFDRVTLLQI